MALSIKDPETERLVRRLAERKGTGVTGAIRLAVDNELSRDDAEREARVQRTLAAIRDIQDRVAARGGLPNQQEIDDWMYDENGAPH